MGNHNCSMAGHRWDKSERNIQKCRREGCSAYRIRVVAFAYAAKNLKRWVVVEDKNELILT